MSAKVKPVPDGYRSVTPYLFVRGASDALAFYARAFNARERMRIPGPGGRLAHAEIEIGDSVIMLSDESPEMSALGPQSLGGTSFSVMIYVEDVDAMYQQAIAAGAKALHAVQTQFYGDRSGSVIDPFGHQWYLATHVEDVSPEEVFKRMDAMMKNAGGS